MKVVVLKDCVDSKREFLKAKTVITLDKSKDSKLLDLGLVREYDEETDANINVSEAMQIENLKIENEKLKGFLEVSINSPKGTIPEGYEV